MDWFDELLAALSGGGGSELDAAMMAAGSTPVSYNPADYGGLDAAMIAAGSTPLSYGGSADTPFYLRPGFLQGAGSAIGGLGQAYAGQRAAGAQVDAANLAIEAQRRARDEDIARLQPRLTAGNNALAQMQSGAFAQPAAFRFGKGDLVLDPSYDYELGESIKALQRTAAARGGLLSGATLKAVSEDARQRANRGYNDAYNRALTGYNADVARSNTGYNRLAGLADIGQTAGTQIGAAGQNYATNFGNLTGQAGQATGAGYLGAGSSVNNLFGALSNQYNTNQMMDILRESRRSSYA